MDTKTNLKPASKDTETTYDPQGDATQHDGYFGSLCPGVVNSGNLKHKHGPEGDHSISEEPPKGLKGE